ncbi:hypothetical protein CI610_00377 [invertebrate metagenome]|uniref:Spore coat protein U domain-containing protein n=1 Tax=invertebrate metagenome TaxID=1711999 RepID=A0A2H9TBZ4_9ZZZZ
MRLTICTLLFFAVTLHAAPPDKDDDDAQLKLDPPKPNPLVLVYDTQLSGQTVFCAATPPRQKLALQVDCTGSPACTREYTLAGSAGSTAPIILKLTDNHGSNLALTPGVRYENLPSQGANCGTANNADDRMITVTVNKTNIDWTKAPFERTFQITAENIEKNRLDTETFTVLFGEEGIIRISNLKDLVLSKDNGWRAQNEQVCVVSSTPFYNLTATSANGGTLRSAGNGIAYSLKYRPHNVAVWESLDFGQPSMGLEASRSESCNDQVYIGIQAEAQDNDVNTVPSGHYSDTVTVTVEAG